MKLLRACPRCQSERDGGFAATCDPGTQTIARPKLVHEQVVATINRAKQGCLMG